MADERGFLTIQFVVAVALSFLLVVLVANLIVWQYGRGVVRSALDEGVRTGSRATASVGDCQARAEAVLRDLLGGSMGRGVSVACSETGDRIVATASVRFGSWLPVMPDWSFHLTGSDVKERQP